MPSGTARQWRRLNGRQRKLSLAALFLLPAVDLMLRFSNYHAVYQRLRRVVPLKEGAQIEGARERGVETAAMVDLAGRWRFIDSSCLRRSLVLWLLLRRQGVESDLRVGIGRENDRIAGHAWVEIGGQVINDKADVAGRYLVVDPDTLA